MVRERTRSDRPNAPNANAAAWLASVVNEATNGNDRAPGPSAFPPPEPPQLPAFEGDFEPTKDVGWQRLWLSMQRTDWSSLVLVPAAADFNTFRSARALAAVGWHHLGAPVDAFNATVLELSGLTGGLKDLARRGSLGRRSIIALPSVLDNPIALAIARSADAALVCLRLGDSIRDAERTVDEIGVATVLGTTIVRGRKESR